jgi:nicotinamide-nucleotide amidase
MPPLPSLRTAQIIAVGSELLGWTRLDTNSLYLAQKLSDLGIELRVKAVVGDDRDDLASIFREALGRADLVVITGGLGPTDDDLTRDVVAHVLQLPLHTDEAIVAAIEGRFARRGLRMPEVNRRQAQVPQGATVLPNPNGTAPGLFIEHALPESGESRVIVLLPGPPRELQPMFDALCAGPLARHTGAEKLYRTSLFVTGRSESHVEEAVQPIYSRWRDDTPPIVTTILAAPGQIELHLTVRDTDPQRAGSILAQASADLRGALGSDVFSVDGRSMEEIVGEQLRLRSYTFAAAESCTGGLLTSRLTDVPGSSAYVHAAVVAYDNDAKVTLLGVSKALIDEHGAVSEPVAIAMADGVRSRTGADVVASITGIAGPGGGSEQKPVGTVVIAVSVPTEPTFVRTYSFIGARAQVKFQSTQAALDRIRRMLS